MPQIKELDIIIDSKKSTPQVIFDSKVEITLAKPAVPDYIPDRRETPETPSPIPDRRPIPKPTEVPIIVPTTPQKEPALPAKVPVPSH